MSDRSGANVRLLVRTAIDWKTMTAARFAAQDDSATPAEFVKGLVARNVLAIWNRAFAVGFFEFRDALQDIANRNLHAVRDTTVTIGLAQASSWYEADDDEFVFPIDDDDLFHPDLARLASRARPTTDLIVWPHVQYAYDVNGAPFLRQLRSGALLTNNWGIRKSFLRRHLDIDGAQRMLSDHKAACSFVARVLGMPAPQPTPMGWVRLVISGPSVEVQPVSFGMSLKHVGSLTSLWDAVRAPDPVASLRRVRLDESAAIPPALSWTAAYVREVELLFTRLGAGRRQ